MLFPEARIGVLDFFLTSDTEQTIKYVVLLAAQQQVTQGLRDMVVDVE